VIACAEGGIPVKAGWSRMALRVRLLQACLVVAAGVLAVSVAGCVTDGAGSWGEVFAPASAPVVTPTVQDPADVQYFPSDEPLRLGMEHFNRGHYGTAERYFRDAVEKAPKDATAWVGLAASYDRIGRFDLADRAYAAAIRLVGETTDILNNLGYSYMLRGNYAAAREKFVQALKREPRNPTILNNLRLLDSSHHAVSRSPDVEKQ
jgi:Flp pilus assembly protein TadD